MICCAGDKRVVALGAQSQEQEHVPQREQDGINAKLKQIVTLVGERDRDSYEALRQRLIDARKLFHELLAERLTPAFNGHLAALPHETLEEKQALTRHANAEMRSLGLAIKCPRTGRPAMLHADRGRDPDTGRFQVALIGSDGERARTVSANSLLALELMGHPERREGAAQYWAERIARRRPRERGS